MADRLAHPSHLPLPTLVDGQRDGARGEAPYRCGRRDAVLEAHACAQRTQRTLSYRRAVDHREVSLRDFEAWMREAMRQLTVVGQQDQAAGVDVQAPHRIEPQLAGHKRYDGRPALVVTRRRDDSERLVDRIDDPLWCAVHRL